MIEKRKSVVTLMILGILFIVLSLGVGLSSQLAQNKTTTESYAAKKENKVERTKEEVRLRKEEIARQNAKKDQKNKDKVKDENITNVSDVKMTLPVATKTQLNPELLLQKNYRDTLFSWMGSTRGVFTDDEINKLANNSGIVVIAKFHAGNDFTVHGEEAKRVKAINPSTKVLVYQSSRLVFPYQSKFDIADGFNNDWLLRYEIGSSIGQPIKYGSTQDLYTDLTNDNYRKWMLDRLARYLTQAPFDGIAFDNTMFIGSGVQEQAWRNRLTVEKITAWNESLKLLLAEARIRFPNKVLLYNGFEDKPENPNRNLILFNDIDMGINEDFCLVGPTSRKVYRTPDQVAEDLNLMKEFTKVDTGKVLLQKANFNEVIDGPTFGKTSSQMERYCYGQFMLGRYGNRSFVKISPGYQNSDLDHFTVEAKIELGEGVSDYVRTGDLFYREFKNGYVFVNTGSDELTFSAPTDLVVVNGAVLGSAIAKGQQFVIGQHEAMFFLKK